MTQQEIDNAVARAHRQILNELQRQTPHKIIDLTITGDTLCIMLQGDSEFENLWKLFPTQEVTCAGYDQEFDCTHYGVKFAPLRNSKI